MHPRAERGVTPILGLVLVVGILVLAMTVWQQTVIPNENAAQEFDHFQGAIEDMTELRNAIIAAGSRGTLTGVNVDIGLRYPERVFFLNPPPVTGRLDTGTARAVSFENLRAVDSEAQNTRRIWQDSRSYPDATKGIVYTAPYQYTSDHPVVVTGETVSGAPNGTLVRYAPQTLIDGNRIRWTFITGNLSENGEEATVVAHPHSTSLRTVTVTGNGSGQPIRLRFEPPPQASAASWVTTYGTRIEETNPRVTDVLVDGGDVVVELDPTRTYQLQLAAVRVGEREAATGDPGPTYVITERGDEQSVTVGNRVRLVAEVRDAYNNPVRNATVRFSVSEGEARFLDEEGTLLGSGVNRTIETDAEGRAPVTTVPISASPDVVVNATVLDGNPSLDTAQFDVQVSGDGLGAGAFYTSFTNASAAGADDSTQGARFTVRNLAEDEGMTITHVAALRVSTGQDRIQRANEDFPWDKVLNIEVADSGTADGYYDAASVDIGDTMDLESPPGGVNASTATIPPEQTAEFFLFQFRPSASLDGEFLEIRIEFELGGEDYSVTTTLILF